MIGRAAEVIRDCLAKKNLFQCEVSKRMGEKPQNLNQQLHQQDMKFRKFVEVMEYIGYGIRLEDRGFSRVTPQYGKGIIETGDPEGLFWYLEDGTYFAIDSHKALTVTKVFPDFDGMAKWFQNRLMSNIGVG